MRRPRPACAGPGAHRHACATVGMIQVHPNSRNVIHGRAFLTVDGRTEKIFEAKVWEMRVSPDRCAAAVLSSGEKLMIRTLSVIELCGADAAARLAPGR